MQLLKSNRRILVFLNMSRQGPALVSSVAVHKELLYVYSRGVSPSFFLFCRSVDQGRYRYYGT